MKIEILLATMFYEKEDNEFLNKLNLQTDIIIGNQTNYIRDENSHYNGYGVKVLSRNARGVGLNRNTILFASQADIVIFADNDVRYYDGYAKKIEAYYNVHPRADIVIFNFKESRGEEIVHDINIKNKKAKLKDITKFGTWAVTARRESILKKRITFSLLFGGGAKYGMGEDSLFLYDCSRNGLNIYLSNDTLGEVIHRESTWYQGINEKYLFDKGALFRAMSKRKYKIFIIWHLLKHWKNYRHLGTKREILNIMMKGAKGYPQKG